MTKQQILKKAISKAVKGGFVFEVPVCKNQYQNIIFSHDFAKAFWKTECLACSGIISVCSKHQIEMWKVHLQIMVLEKDRIKYLEKFL